MKVLMPGRNQKGWATKMTCNDKHGGCGAVLLVEEGDVRCWENRDYTGGVDTYCTFKCGYCGLENYCTNLIPHDVRNRRQNKT